MLKGILNIIIQDRRQLSFNLKKIEFLLTDKVCCADYMEKSLCIFLSPGNVKENSESQQSVHRSTLKIDLASKVAFLIERKLLLSISIPERGKATFHTEKVFRPYFWPSSFRKDASVSKFLWTQKNTYLPSRKDILMVRNTIDLNEILPSIEILLFFHKYSDNYEIMKVISKRSEFFFPYVAFWPFGLDSPWEGASNPSDFFRSSFQLDKRWVFYGSNFSNLTFSYFPFLVQRDLW